MSAPSSPYSECSSLEPQEFEIDPKVLRMLVAILTCCHGILHYHAGTDELTTFQWPADQYGQRILPSQFAAYREAHIFRYPCCFCAKSDGYVEASIFRRTTGISQGEYAAECATSTCGYMVNVEKFIGRAYVPAVYYPHRETKRRFRRMLRQSTHSMSIRVAIPTAVNSDKWVVWNDSE